MIDFNKEDWIINNRNVFELPETESAPISAIQYEILKQIEGKNIASILDFLNAEIDTQKTIMFTKGLNIDTIFSNHLELDINPLKTMKKPVFSICEWLTLYLFKRLADNDHFSETDTYKEKYQTIKNDWLNQNIDTDEKDFVNNELAKCEAIILELQKPIYNKLFFSEVQPEPTEFKRNLTNIIDKRIKFLNEILTTFEAQNLPPQQPETVKPDEDKKELHNHIFKGNAFELFEKYHTEKELTPSCRTDFNLLFQLFKKYNLLAETVELKHYINWLNENEYYSQIELKKVDINSRPNRQRTNDFKRYANDLKITLK